MTNTINNVPRELLNIAALHLEYSGYTETGKKLRTLLDAAPSPAGMDGLEVVGIQWLDTGHYRKKPPKYGFNPYDWSELCRISDAQAIIDGLRGEVEALQSMITDLSKTGIRMRAERDNQARRAGELAAALEFACKSLAQVTSSDGSGHADIAVSVLRMAGRKEADASQIVEAYKAGAKWRIDAALSAGKGGE